MLNEDRLIAAHCPNIIDWILRFREMLDKKEQKYGIMKRVKPLPKPPPVSYNPSLILRRPSYALLLLRRLYRPFRLPAKLALLHPPSPQPSYPPPSPVNKCISQWPIQIILSRFDPCLVEGRGLDGDLGLCFLLHQLLYTLHTIRRRCARILYIKFVIVRC